MFLSYVLLQYRLSLNFFVILFQRPTYGSSRNQINRSANQDNFSFRKSKKVLETRSLPRREGLRPRRSKAVPREQLMIESEDEQGTSEDKVDEDETENGNDVDDNDADGREGEDEGEG